VAVAALLLWLCTAAIGAYLLVTAVHAGNVEPAPEESVPVPAEQPAAASAPTAPARPRRNDRDRFAPPSLRQARSEPLPGMKDLAEFTHPALAMIGIGFWLGYVVSRDRLFAVIGLGILLGAICAGVSLFTVNACAARRAAAAPGAAPAAPGTAPLTASPLVLTLHAIGATVTLLFAVLIAVRA
jgi:pyruvate dehydrogenase E2 component (dihydrolipoamide acetyltransferase)